MLPSLCVNRCIACAAGYSAQTLQYDKIQTRTLS